MEAKLRGGFSWATISRANVRDRAGFLIISVVMLIFGLYFVVKPEAVKKENADVPGFPKTGFSWMPVWGWRLVGVALLGVAGLCLYIFLTHREA